MRYIVALVLSAMTLAAPARAASVDVGVAAKDISISPAARELVAGSAIRVYVRVHNLGSEDVLAAVRLSVGKATIGQTEPVPVRAGATADTWIDWVVPAASFKLTAAASAPGDTEAGNNQATTAEFKVVPGANEGRDIFSPPDGRENISLASSTGASSTVASTTDASSTAATTTEPVPVGWTSPVPPEPVARAAAKGVDEGSYTWIPYALILLGAVGFAWGMRGKRRQYTSAPRPAAPAPAAPKSRRRPAPVKPAAAAPKPVRRRGSKLAPPQV